MAVGQNSGQAGARRSGADANLEPSANEQAMAKSGGDSSVADQSTHVPPRRVTILRVAVALLLLTSAAFKVHAIFTEPYFADSILGSPVWMVGLVECEILLGLWLLSGVALRSAWLTALVAFAGFACVNVYLLATGATTCGCFGTVEMHPWVMLGLDVVVFVALTISIASIWRGASNVDLSAGSKRMLQHALLTATVAATLTSVGALWLIAEYGSVVAGIHALRGELISIEPHVGDAGRQPVGTQKTIEVLIRNSTSDAVTIVGGTTTCKCVVTQQLPVTIPPFGETKIAIHVRFTAEGSFRQHFTLLTDSSSSPLVRGTIHGTAYSL